MCGRVHRLSMSCLSLQQCVDRAAAANMYQLTGTSVTIRCACVRRPLPIVQRETCCARHERRMSSYARTERDGRCMHARLLRPEGSIVSHTNPTSATTGLYHQHRQGLELKHHQHCQGLQLEHLQQL